MSVCETLKLMKEYLKVDTEGQMFRIEVSWFWYRNDCNEFVPWPCVTSWNVFSISAKRHITCIKWIVLVCNSHVKS